MLPHRASPVSDRGSTPSEFSPHDRVRLRHGMFRGLVGEVVEPDADRPGDWRVGLHIWGREVEVSLAGWMLELAG